MGYKPTGNPTGRPKKYDDAAIAGAMRARLSKDRALAGSDVVAEAVEDVPPLTPAQIATVMRHLGLRAVRFVAETMQDESVETKHRIAAAQMLISRRWLDAPSDPSVLVQQNNLSLSADAANDLLARLRGLR